MSARGGAARTPLLQLKPPPQPPPQPPLPARTPARPAAAVASSARAALLLPRLWQRKGAGRGGSGGVAAGGVSVARPRRLLQLLALLLAASGYGLLLASSALVSVQQMPPPPPQPQPEVQLSPVPGPPNHQLQAPDVIPPHLPASQVVLARPDPAPEALDVARAAGAPASDGAEAEDSGGDGGGDLDPEAMEAELEDRRRLVHKVCKEKELEREGQVNAWEFFIDPRHGLVWCNIFKAASTAWLYNFNLLAGYKDSYLRRAMKPPLALARARYPRPTPQQLRAALPDSLSFLIVREPFERLLSAYRNKLEGLRHRYYRKLAREIARRPRRRPLPTHEPAPAQEHNAVDAENAIPPQPPALPGPSFDQFVDYVIDTGLRSKNPHFDEHWAPYYKFCTPCHVDFNVVAKVETLARDEDYIIRRAGLENTLAAAAARRRERPRKITNRARGVHATAQLVQEYYGVLTQSQLRDLYQIYGTDFEMFGYNVTKYYGFVRPDS